MNERTDNGLLTKLVEQLHAPLILYARQWLENEAEDIVQEAFLRLLCHFHKDSLHSAKRGPQPDPQKTDSEKPGIENPAAWLFRVVRNESISRLRRRILMGRHLEIIRNQHKSWFEVGRTTIENDDIAEKIADIPMELREVLVSKLWGGLSFQEIGELTETSQSTAHRRYNEALYHLKEKLSKDF